LDNKQLVEADVRNKIIIFERELSKLPGTKKGDMDECPLKHSFADGIYVREIFIPKGMLIVGKLHKHEHPNFLMSGSVQVITESGGKETLTAPLSMISPAGTKRVVFTLEDTVWITIHRTDKTNPKDAEEDIIAKSYAELPDEVKRTMEIGINTINISKEER